TVKRASMVRPFSSMPLGSKPPSNTSHSRVKCLADWRKFSQRKRRRLFKRWRRTVAKSTRGLPPDFSLDIPDTVRDAPVQLGDYLDEVEATPVARPAPALRKASESKVVEL